MNRTTITRRLEFCAGHRVSGHEGKCQRLHGHQYTAEVECVGLERALDSIGRVIDFSVVKNTVGAWIDENWDHRMLLWDEDPMGLAIFDASPEGSIVWVALNPTAENLAFLLIQQANEMLFDEGIGVIRVRLWETPNCFAEVSVQT